MYVIPQALVLEILLYKPIANRPRRVWLAGIPWILAIFICAIGCISRGKVHSPWNSISESNKGDTICERAHQIHGNVIIGFFFIFTVTSGVGKLGIIFPTLYRLRLFGYVFKMLSSEVRAVRRY